MYLCCLDTMDLTGAILRVPSGIGPVRSETYWQQKLEKAQNVLFCKEIFAQVHIQLIFNHDTQTCT